MQTLVLSIDRPDGNTHEAHKNFRTRLNDIESEVLDILDKYPVAMSQLSFTLRYQRLQTKIDLLSNEIEALTPKCSLTTVLLDINGSVLKSIECPQLTVSTYKAPGFFSSINKIIEFISLHPAHGRFHLQIITICLSRSLEPTS